MAGGPNLNLRNPIQMTNWSSPCLVGLIQIQKASMASGPNPNLDGSNPNNFGTNNLPYS